MKLKDWLDENSNSFSDNDLRFLLRETLNKKYFSFFDDINLSEPKLVELEKAKQDYIKGMPIAYILGKEEFFGQEFKINSDVLIPRKETEIIVEKALMLIKDNGLKSVLDLCCGSGIIAIILKKMLLNAISVYAGDISQAALKQAKINACFHKVEINFEYSDLFNAFSGKQFNLIVSNPPYVESKNIQGGLTYEPQLALDGGIEGVCCIEKILNQAYNYLENSGYLIIEMGYNHKDKVESIIDSVKNYKIIEWIKDYDGNWRGVILKSSK